MPATLSSRFDDAPMSRVQVRAVALTVLLSALDGYDVLSVTFAAPAITQEWGIGRAALGVVLSSGLAGMALGSFVLGPFADLIGRRRTVLISLVLMAIGSLLCVSAKSLTALSLWRVLTGFGIGACIAVINPIAAEFSNRRRRPLAMSFMAMGYPAGGLAGGLLAAYLLKFYTWPAVFFAGFVAAVFMLPLVALLLPESLGFLLSREDPKRLDRVNALLTRCDQPELIEMPTLGSRRRGYSGVFTPSQLPATVRLMLVNMLVASVIYYTLSWLPQMVADAGFAPSTASVASATLNFIGIIGGLSLGALARLGGLKRLTVGAVFALAASIAAFGLVTPSLVLILSAAGLCGFFIFAVSAGFYATLASSFPDEARASGSGFVIGSGRVSSALAPLIAGWLFSVGLGRAEVSLAFAGCAILAGVILSTHRYPEGTRS